MALLALLCDVELLRDLLQNPDPGENVKPPYNAQQLEDCDMFPPDSAVLQRVDGTSHEVSHQVRQLWVM